jgi:SAM-dependent methyltransferase
VSSIAIETEKPIAYDSPDHLQPHGTAVNNTTNPRFNQKLFRMIPPPRVRLLDIGCSGGGLVKSILDDGGFAVGVEGSDYSLEHKRAEWATIPSHLFTADATEPFQLSEIDESGRKTPLTFNVITAWEFFEHIPEQGLAPIVKNILNHLAPGGIVLASIATYPDVVNGVVLHQTIHMRPWWVKTFARLGLERQEEIEKYFGFDMVNGSPLNDSSFAIALTRAGESPEDPRRIHELARAETVDRVVKTWKWWLNPKKWKRHAWYWKRTVESRLPGGRPFPY